MTLDDQWLVSFSPSKGRAGRTAPGVCVRLYQDTDLTRAHIVPEILRSSLDDVVLQLSRLNYNPTTFPFMDQPDPSLIASSLEILQAMRCLKNGHEITK